MSGETGGNPVRVSSSRNIRSFSFLRKAASAGKRKAYLQIKSKREKIKMKLVNKKMKSMLLCMMLIVAMAFTTVGCGGKKDEITGTTTSETTTQVSSEKEETQQTTEETVSETESVESTEASAIVLGEGNTKFMFVVIDADGNETDFEIHTDKETVGDALLEENLIAGDDSEYGLYVKTVNGITADYDTDQTYWAFYINDEYAATGVDSTPVTEGDTYSFKVEK